MFTPAGATCTDYLGFDELVEKMRQARAVVTHAGVGSVLTALLKVEAKRPAAERRDVFDATRDSHSCAFRWGAAILRHNRHLTGAIVIEDHIPGIESLDVTDHPSLNGVGSTLGPLRLLRRSPFMRPRKILRLTSSRRSS